MKFIPYKSFKDDANSVDTFAVLTMYLNDARQSGGVNYEEMGQRIDLVKKMRAAEAKDGVKCPGLIVDAAEYKLLTGLAQYKFPWGASDCVYEIIGDVMNATAPITEQPAAAAARRTKRA